jgi:hypothetical protein
MRRFLLTLSMLLVMIAVQKTASAQCYTNWTAGSCPISGGSCSTQTPVVNGPVEYGYNYKWQKFLCCGEQVTIPESQLGLCYTAELQNPETTKSLSALAKTERVLVAGCDGYLRTFSSRLDNDRTEHPNISWSPHARRNLNLATIE